MPFESVAIAFGFSRILGGGIVTVLFGLFLLVLFIFTSISRLPDINIYSN